jgi:hypothetical protein
VRQVQLIPRQTTASVALFLTMGLALAAWPAAAAGGVPPGNAPDLAIFFTGDVQGYIDPCG